jgi:hypothetical protein
MRRGQRRNNWGIRMKKTQAGLQAVLATDGADPIVILINN